jgi:hypothetical protein
MFMVGARDRINIPCAWNLTDPWIGLREALKQRLNTFLCTDRQQSETPVPGFQPMTAHPVTVPEYFAEFRDKGDLLSEFLGCGIVAKVGAPIIHNLPILTPRSLDDIR